MKTFELCVRVLNSVDTTTVLVDGDTGKQAIENFRKSKASNNYGIVLGCWEYNGGGK